MPYDVNWLLENRVIYMRDYGVCTGAELEAALQKVDTFFSMGEAPVHLIHDNRDVEQFPASLTTIKAAMKVNENAGLLIYIVNPNQPASRFITTTLTTIARKPFRYAADLEEAQALLQEHDSTLPPFPPNAESA